MPGTNGSPVSWRELNLALDPLHEDVREIKADLTELRADLKAARIIADHKAFLGYRGRTVVNGLLVAVPAALVSVLVTIIIH